MVREGDQPTAEQPRPGAETQAAPALGDADEDPDEPGRQRAPGGHRPQNGPRTWTLDPVVLIAARALAPCTLRELRDHVGRRIPIQAFTAAVDRLHAAGELSLKMGASRALVVHLTSDDAPEADDAA